MVDQVVQPCGIGVRHLSGAHRGSCRQKLLLAVLIKEHCCVDIPMQSGKLWMQKSTSVGCDTRTRLCSAYNTALNCQRLVNLA